MHRTNQAASRCVALASALVVLSPLVLATRSARAQDVTSPPAAAFPSADAPPVPSVVPSAPPAPPAEVPSSPPPVDAPVLPEPVTPSAPVAPAVVSPPAAPPALPNTGSAAFAPLPEPARTPSIEPSRVTPRAKPAAPRAAVIATPPLAGSEPYAAPAPNNEPNDSKDDSNGVFGPFRIGFLIGTGLPDLVSLGGVIKVTKYLGFGVNVGIIPTVKLSLYGDATLSYQEYDVYGHIFPFGGGFFLGTGVGYGTIKGTVKNKYTLTPDQSAASGLPPSVEIDSAGSVRTMVLTPQIGFLHTFASGFSLGADVGAQIPIAPSQVDYQTQEPEILKPFVTTTTNDDKVRSTLDTIGRTTLPTINVKIGWLL